jgi:uncharacterized membrane protein
MPEFAKVGARSASEAVPPHVAESLENVVELHKRTERQVPRHQRTIEGLTALLGRSSSVILIVGAVFVWVMGNLLLLHAGRRTPDPPPFYALQSAASVGALLMAAMVLATQNRQRKRSEDLERLDLQINLLAEQKLAKLISLVEELRRDMPNVVNRVDPVAEAMTQAVDPHAVADALKETMEDVSTPPLDDRTHP